MAKSARKSIGSAAATQTFRALVIDRRVLTTPARTISIRNIATLSIGTHSEPRSFALLAIAGLLAITAILALSLVSTFNDGVTLAAAAFAILSAAFGYAYLRPQDKTPYLIVSTADGTLTRFTGPKREMLDDVRDIIAQKINTADEESSYSVDFETGTIEDLRVKEVAGLHDSSAIAAKVASPANGLNTAKANGTSAHLDASEAVYIANGAVTNGTTQNHSPATPPANGTYIDYSDFLPAIVEMHRFYARQPNAEHLEQRLSELEMLMRAGATGSHQKQRVRELADEVSQILQAYPSAVQIFQNVANLTG